MRGAARLYALHVALAALGLALLGGSAALILARQSFALPSSRAVSEACDRWLAAGGPASLLGLAVALLALTVLGLALASACRQARASRRYLATLPIRSEAIEVDGVACRPIGSAEPQAFCAGYLRPRIYLSNGAREQLSRAELGAVLAHEAHHLRRRDPLRLLAARTLADALFFLPILRQIGERYAALAELAADEAAVRATRGPAPLASALLKFSELGPRAAPVVAIAPERVDHLMGDPDAARWELPRSPLGRSALALFALAALSLLVWGGVLHPDLRAPLLAAAACASLLVCGPLTLAALLASRYAFILRHR